MSLVDSLLNVMHMNPDDDEDYYDDEYDYEEEEEETLPKSRRSRQAKQADEPVYKNSGGNNQPIDINRNRDRTARTNNKVTPMRPSAKKSNSSGLELCVIKPTAFEEAREITETLLLNRPVILNVEGLDVDIAQRIIDFSSGSCYAIGGNLQKVSNYIFVLTPANVEISGDFQNLIDTYGAAALRMEM
ncbi:MAG: cell division protein SepF [Eubacterium sp.]|nr:cell division protein SepF [Eubacterium sp.]